MLPNKNILQSFRNVVPMLGGNAGKSVFDIYDRFFALTSET